MLPAHWRGHVERCLLEEVSLELSNARLQLPDPSFGLDCTVLRLLQVYRSDDHLLVPLLMLGDSAD